MVICEHWRRVLPPGIVSLIWEMSDEVLRVSWDLIRSVQRDTDLRLIMPFGLDLRVGDVVSVAKDGTFTLEGTCGSLLGLSPGSRRRLSQGEVDLYRQSSDSTKCEFRAEGTASGLFPNLPTASARFDIAFGSERGWILAFVGRSLQSLAGVNRFRSTILDAYKRKVWKADWALVTSVGKVQRMTLLASSSRNTRVTLSLGGKVNPAGPYEAKLTAGASIMATSEQVTQCITRRPMMVFCSALRIRDGWFSSPEIGTLDVSADARLVRSAPDCEFWEDADTPG